MSSSAISLTLRDSFCDDQRSPDSKGSKMSVERDAGFCSGGDDEDAEDGLQSPTDASEDSVEVKVSPISLRNKNKRKCAEPRKVAAELCPYKKRRPLAPSPGPFRPWSPAPYVGRTQEEPLALVLRRGEADGRGRRRREERVTPCVGEDPLLSRLGTLAARVDDKVAATADEKTPPRNERLEEDKVETESANPEERIRPQSALPSDRTDVRDNPVVTRESQRKEGEMESRTSRHAERIHTQNGRLKGKFEQDSVMTIDDRTRPHLVKPEERHAAPTQNYTQDERIDSTKIKSPIKLVPLPSTSETRPGSTGWMDDRARHHLVRIDDGGQSIWPEDRLGHRLPKAEDVVGHSTSRHRDRRDRAHASETATRSTARSETVVDFSLVQRRPPSSEARFSVEALLGGGERPGPSSSSSQMDKKSDGSTVGGQQRNYKNMTRERRIEANARERTRVHTISAAFDTLRRAIPAYSHNQKLSKLSVLRIACSYILTLSRVAGSDYSADNSEPSLADCVDLVSRTIQTEGKLRRKKED